MKLYRYYKKNRQWVLYDVQNIFYRECSIVYFRDFDSGIQCKDVIK